MLVLSRKVGEQVHIGDGITVTVLASQGGRVRLGVAAPRDVRIRRGELSPHCPDLAQPECGSSVSCQVECLVH